MDRSSSVGPCNFFFNAPATTEIYTLSLHDALPISRNLHSEHVKVVADGHRHQTRHPHPKTHQRRVDGIRRPDRKSTRLNSSHMSISYAVFCLKKKTNHIIHAGHIILSMQGTAQFY